MSPVSQPTIVCFSHLRWNFVYQRPQHLLSRASAHARVFYMEEPIVGGVKTPELRMELQPSGVTVLTPLISQTMEASEAVVIQQMLLDRWLEQEAPAYLIVWYYTPMALLFSSHLHPDITVYDCMDQLSAFQGAPAGLEEQEERLFQRADVVFAGGRSLYESKRGRHENLHLFPSSVDYDHFSSSRSSQIEPTDQILVPHPRIGFFGVLDERLDVNLLREMAARQSSWHFILIGPVVKIREDELPHAANIHYLGAKKYAELPAYIAHWDVAMLPFAQNESTRYISPTKTPEYLAAGKPVISTPVRDVEDPYGRLGLARIAATPEEFCEAIEESLVPPTSFWLSAVDDFLRRMSWDQTFRDMWELVILCKDNGTLGQENKEVTHV